MMVKVLVFLFSHKTGIEEVIPKFLRFISSQI